MDLAGRSGFGERVSGLMIQHGLSEANDMNRVREEHGLTSAGWRHSSGPGTSVAPAFSIVDQAVAEKRFVLGRPRRTTVDQIVDDGDLSGAAVAQRGIAVGSVEEH